MKKSTSTKLLLAFILIGLQSPTLQAISFTEIVKNHSKAAFSATLAAFSYDQIVAETFKNGRSERKPVFSVG